MLEDMQCMWTLFIANRAAQSAAANASTQRFHYISADLTSAGDCSRLIQEATAWNHDAPPDIVWCCAGSAYPGFFLEAPVEKLREQMDSNYWSAAYTAHATLKSWLAPSKSSVAITTPRHLVLTSSVVAFYPIVGYAGYSPAKAAIRSLSDTLSQELCLYNGSRQHGSSPGPAADVRIHTIFPGTIFSPGYEIENQTKPAITKKLEEDEGGQTEDEIAHISVKALEKGEYLVTAAFLGSAMRASAWGGSPRNNRVRDTVMSWITSIAWLFVQPDLDGKTWKWGKEKGHPSFYDAQPAAPVG